jgi:hypothetical protein
MGQIGWALWIFGVGMWMLGPMMIEFERHERVLEIAG